MSDIKRWNHLSSNNIRIGQRLTIYTSPNIVHAAKKSPSTGASVNSLGNYYTMQNGDTLWEIAKAKGISYDSLLKLNSGVDFKRLKPGDKILITSG